MDLGQEKLVFFGKLEFPNFRRKNERFTTEWLKNRGMRMGLRDSTEVGFRRYSILLTFLSCKFPWVVKFKAFVVRLF